MTFGWRRIATPHLRCRSSGRRIQHLRTMKRFRDSWKGMRLLLPALLGACLLSGCGFSQAPHAAFHQLVDVETLSRPPQLDIRYATTANFTHQRLYPRAKVFLHQDTARALAAVQADLARD